MSTNEELQHWMQAVATCGDRQAFAALFRHFAPRIKGYLLASGSDPQVAEELAQETLVAVWRKADSFDPDRASLSTWVYTIARNLRIDLGRRRLPVAGEQGDWDADQLPADARASPEDLVLLAQRARGIRRALQALPAEQADVLRLSFFQEQPHVRIAAQLGLPLGTVKSRIRLAVAQLRRLLEGMEP